MKEKQEQTEQEIKRLIALKKKQEEETLSQQELIKLQNFYQKHPGYENLSSEEMQKKLDEDLKVKKVQVISDGDIDPIIQAYNDKYKNETWYKEPVTQGNETTFTFPSLKEASSFFLEQAKNVQEPFIIVDGKTNKVMAYSKGDGKLYHSDGKEFEQGHTLTPGEHDAAKFEIPDLPKSLKM